MKKTILFMSLLMSSVVIADTFVLTNESNCYVEQEQKRNGTVIYLQKGSETQIVGFASDYSFGDLTYCADDVTEVGFYEGDYGKEVRLSCSAHQNGNFVTRGRATLSFDAQGVIRSVEIEGQVKKLFGWKKEILVCDNLKAQSPR